MFSKKVSHLLHLNFGLTSAGFWVKDGLKHSETGGVPPGVAFMGVAFMGVVFMGVILVGVALICCPLMGET